MTYNRRFLLLIACALLAGAAHALQPDSKSAASKSSNASRNMQQSHHVVNNKIKPQPYTKTGAKQYSDAVSTQLSTSPQAANGQPPAVLGNSASPSQPAQIRGAGVAKHAVLRTPPVGDALPIRPPGLESTGAMSHNDMRHHGPNPSAFGGVASSKGTNAASINGSAVHHRP